MTDLESLKLCAFCYEKKLKELMGEKEFEKFAFDVAKKAFVIEISEMKDEKFKQFCIENFDRIINEKEQEKKE